MPRKVILNFPVSYLPEIFDISNSPTVIRQRLYIISVSFGLLYYIHKMSPTEYELQRAMSEFKINGPSKQILEIGQRLYKRWTEDPSPLTFIYTKHLQSFVDSCGYLDEIDIISFRAYLAFHSICRKIGIDTITNLDLLYARMDGKSKGDCTLSPQIQKWKTTKMWRKIKKYLTANYRIRFTPNHTRGIKFKNIK